MKGLKIGSDTYYVVSDFSSVNDILLENKLGRSGKLYKYVNIENNKYYNGSYGTYVEAKGEIYFFVKDELSIKRDINELDRIIKNNDIDKMQIGDLEFKGSINANSSGIRSNTAAITFGEQNSSAIANGILTSMKRNNFQVLQPIMSKFYETARLAKSVKSILVGYCDATRYFNILESYNPFEEAKNVGSEKFKITTDIKIKMVGDALYVTGIERSSDSIQNPHILISLKPLNVADRVVSFPVRLKTLTLFITVVNIYDKKCLTSRKGYFKLL